jgi:hypothetical protein
VASAARSGPEIHRWLLVAGAMRREPEIHNGGRGRSANVGTVNAVFVGERPVERLKAKST